jgi:hypothetical protein
MNQSDLKVHQSEIQAEFEANQKAIAAIEAKQAELKRVLYRYNVHGKLVASRSIPQYASWLPFSAA